MSVLSTSSLPLEELDIFHNPEMPFVTLAGDDLYKADYGKSGLAAALPGLHYLYIGLSENSRLDNEYLASHVDPDAHRAAIVAQKNFASLPELLRYTTLLKNLAIHYYRLEQASFARVDPFIDHRQLLSNLLESESLPQLRGCELRGVIATSDDLLKPVQRTRPRTLLLSDIQLPDPTDSWNRFIQYCTRKGSSLTQIIFQNLMLYGGGVLLWVPSNPLSNKDVKRLLANRDEIQNH